MISNFNLFAYFATSFEKQTDKELLVTLGGESLSYKDIDQLSSRLARYLEELGTKVGDRISIQINK